MNVVEGLEEVPTLDLAQDIADVHPSQSVEADSPTQQMLDDLLGRLEEEDDSPIFLARGLTHELYADLDE